MKQILKLAFCLLLIKSVSLVSIIQSKYKVFEKVLKNIEDQFKVAEKLPI